MYILLGIVIFLQLVKFIVFADVILSWLRLFGLNIRPKFIADIIDPLYENIKKYIPTTIGPIEFTPIVIIILVHFISNFILLSQSEVFTLYQNLFN